MDGDDSTDEEEWADAQENIAEDNVSQEEEDGNDEEEDINE